MGRVGSYTAGQTISHIETRLKQYTKQTIPPEQWFEMIGVKVAMIHEVLSTKDKAVYRDNFVLTNPLSGLGGIVPKNQGASYVNSTKTLTISDAGFTGFFSVGVDSFNNVPVGSLVVITNTSLRPSIVFLTKIASITDANNAVLLDAYGADITGSNCSVSIIIGDLTDSIRISTLSAYPYIDQITSIYSTSIEDECKEMDNLNHFFYQKKTVMNYSYRNQIIWVRDGEYLRFAKGSSVSSYGTRTVYHTRKPYPVTALSDLIDCPDSNLDLLFKSLILDGLQVLEVPIPSELQSAQNQISLMLQAKEKELADSLNMKSEN